MVLCVFLQIQAGVQDDFHFSLNMDGLRHQKFILSEFWVLEL